MGRRRKKQKVLRQTEPARQNEGPAARGGRPGERAAAGVGPRLRAGGPLVLVLILVLVGALAWWGWPREGRAPTRDGPPLPRDPARSVVLLSVDTLRADAVGAYRQGDAEAATATPWMDRLAHEGVRFETARAHNVVTLPSHASLLSGRLPLGHGIRDNAGFRVPRGIETLATLLGAAGYRTGAFVSAFVLDSRFGLDRGFEVYDDRAGGAAGPSAFAVPERPALETVAAATRWLEDGDDTPSFLFVHLYEPHAPYQPPEPFASRFSEAPYHGEVAAADAALGTLLKPLLDAASSRRSLVILTSDHGEGLGEHGEQTHGIFAYDSTLRVPLVLHAPDLLEPRVVAEPVRLVDVMPTVLDLLGLDPPPDIDGRSLLPLVAGRDERAGDTYFEALSPSLERGWAPLHGLVSGDRKYIELPIPELYDLGVDPGERRNLASEHPEDVEDLRARLSALRAVDPGVGQRATEDAATLERLRALGYVVGERAPRKESYGPEDDPKNLIALERREAEVLRRVHAGDYDRARELCRQILAERPDMSLTWTQLASIERARGDLNAAAEAGRRAVALRPGDPAGVSLVAGILIEAGQPEEARKLLVPWLDQAPPDPDILIAEGMALVRLGRPNEALATFTRARKSDPGNALALTNIGMVHLMSGAADAAREAFEAAVAADPGAAPAHNGLGVLAARDERPAEAIEHWRRAVEADPRDYRTLFNLGATLRAQGRGEEARPYLEAYLRTAPRDTERADRARVRQWLEGLS